MLDFWRFCACQRFCACAVVCLFDRTLRNEKPSSSYLKLESIYQHYYWISLDIFYKTCWTKILKAITSLVIDGKGEPLLIQVLDCFLRWRFFSFLIIKVEKKSDILKKPVTLLPFQIFIIPHSYLLQCYMVYGNKTEKIRKTVLHQKFFSSVLTRNKRTVFSLCISFLLSSMYDHLLTNFRNLFCSSFPTS